MLNFPSKPKKDTGWSPPNERNVINNIACMLPSDLNPDTIHFLLLRFQLEEVQYHLNNLTDETKNLKYYDFDSSETKTKFEN